MSDINDAIFFIKNIYSAYFGREKNDRFEWEIRKMPLKGYSQQLWRVRCNEPDKVSSSDNVAGRPIIWLDGWTWTLKEMRLSRKFHAQWWESTGRDRDHKVALLTEAQMIQLAKDLKKELAEQLQNESD